MHLLTDGTVGWTAPVERLSLTDGWVPAALDIATAITVVMAVGWRTRRWRRVWVPASAAFGIGVAGATHWYVRRAGLAGDPPPTQVWLWVALGGVAMAAAVAGWSTSRWWRRGVSLAAIPLSVACVAATINGWVAYFPTVGTVWSELVVGHQPDQIDRATLSAMQADGAVPTRGTVVTVRIDSSVSHFSHRDELVYLPPAWFLTNPPPPLPAVMMIGGEFNSPTDWLRAGNAIATADSFAAAHAGRSPVFVFVDSAGRFDVDTECVNGSRGNAADHLTKDVIPFMIANFGVSAAPQNWGVVGFSAGGTCAVDLTVMHPDLFRSFVDIAGDLSPNSGTKEQTIARLFGGNADAWRAFDPSAVITRHGRYEGVSALFTVSGAEVDHQNRVASADNAERAAANRLCELGTASGITCTVLALPGKHDWTYGGFAFATTLPWLAGQLRTPGVTPTAMPTAVLASPTSAQGAPR